MFVNWLAEKSTKELKELFNSIQMVPEEELTEIDKGWCLQHGIDPGENWYDTLYTFQGCPGALDIVPIMLEGSNFICDSLFCEYAYIANLDTNELEFWIGFQRKPDPDNRYGTKKENGYYPCKLVRAWSFDDDIWEHPEDIVAEMVAVQKREEEE